MTVRSTPLAAVDSREPVYVPSALTRITRVRDAVVVAVAALSFEGLDCERVTRDDALAALQQVLAPVVLDLHWVIKHLGHRLDALPAPEDEDLDVVAAGGRVLTIL